MRLSQIKNQVDALLKRHLVQSPPIPILEILEGQGLVVLPAQFEEYTSEVAGYVDPTAKTIFVNQTDSPARQSVTMGYALGLLALHKEKLLENPDARVCYRKPLLEQVAEPIAADAFSFASFLLIPEKPFFEYQQKEFVSATSLATIFGVTNELLQYRKNLATGK